MGAYNHEVANAFLSLTNCSQCDGQIRPAVLDLSKNPRMTENIVLKNAIEAGLRQFGIVLEKSDYYRVRSELIDHYNERERENNISEQPKIVKWFTEKEAHKTGKTIQFYNGYNENSVADLDSPGNWENIIDPTWTSVDLYRVKPELVIHKHQECIDAFAGGAIIQFLSSNRMDWIDCVSPLWDTLQEYRIKPDDFNSLTVTELLVNSNNLYHDLYEDCHDFKRYGLDPENFYKNLKESCIRVGFKDLNGHQLIAVKESLFDYFQIKRDKDETLKFKHKEYSLGFLATKQAIGETIMNFDKPAVDNRPYIFGVPESELTDATIFSMIKQLEDRISDHDEIKNKPKKLKDEIAKLEGQIKELVDFVDNRK